MSKVKQKKQNVFIDMTAMSDVTVLLLTFFMLTATFLPKEPIQVITPGSVMEIKIPEANLMTILIRPDGNTYMYLDLPRDKRAVLEAVGKDYNVNFTEAQVISFLNQPTIGVPFNSLDKFLSLSVGDQDEYLHSHGLSVDSTNNQLKPWIQYATAQNKDIEIAIKADRNTPYPMVNKVMTTLQELKLNRFNLITTLEHMPAGF